MTTTAGPARGVGELLRDWRRTRGMSQLDLSIEAGVSARHLSFVETGRSRPSPELILRLAEQLDLPLAARNTVLLAGGYAPAYSTHELTDPELDPVRAAVRQILDGHSPYPALLVDKHWHLVEANPAVALFTAGADPRLLSPPVNVLRLSLHPDGMAPRILNLPQWRAHLLSRLRQQAVTSNDPILYDLHEELRGYPGDDAHETPISTAVSRIVVPLRYRHDGREMSFLSTTTLFGTPLDVTVAGLAVEAFFPADPATTASLQALAGPGAAHRP
ncbi:transcriptional regulator with XRE-family HTH domain [Micromonospora profundi]|uniref:helix-turn-helix domain-containing protein n=1 Tax=Micromonospora profundi TaxID=1420889 RepID=UPI00143C9E56|nr:helix-turn-helix transcriptional regulator [Micromonospora profundi]NJC11781.1 transcriptional regulator with XRE-family HTH domain [Micromonospora profundi]